MTSSHPEAGPSAALLRLRKRIGSQAIRGFFEGVSRVGQLHPRADPKVHGVEVKRNIDYTGHGNPFQTLDIWRPKHAKAKAPVVLYLHGGGFRILSKETHWVMALGFARQGYVVVNANYRLAPEHPFPAAVQDACAAYTWLVAHADELSVDLSRLIVAGESAGANLTLAVAVAAVTRRPEPFAQEVFATGVVPKVILPACGLLQVSDVERFARRKPDKVKGFLLDRMQEVSRSYLPPGAGHSDTARQLADPLHVLESDAALDRPFPAVFAGVGTGDALLDDTRRLAAALARRGVVHQVRYYPKQVHAFHAFVFLPEAKRFWREQQAFCDDHVQR